MKPRLRRHFGYIWTCRTPGCKGLGYTPAEAYRDWKEQRK